MNQFPQIVINHSIGNVIAIPNQLEAKVLTYLTDNKAPAVTSLPVDNATDFTSGSTILLLLSSLGAENCEIVTSASHTNTVFTTAATVQPHNRGDNVQQVTYNLVDVYKSTTIDGSYVLLSSNLFQLTQQNTIVLDSTGLTTDFYKVQWKNSVTSAVSNFSAPISVDTYPENSVANIIYPVLTAMGVSENDPKINTTFCISAVDDARKYVQAKLYGIRQDWQENFEHPIKVLAGNNFVDLPDDIDFKKTDRSLLCARFINGNVLAPYNLSYVDKRGWNQVSYYVQGSYNTDPLLIGDIEIQLENSGDFPDSSSGVAYIATTDFDQIMMPVQYTAVDLINNKLLGVTGITRNVPAGTRVWSNPTVSQPILYTVFEGKLYFNWIFPDSMQGNNVYIDYYKKIPVVENLYQELPENYREIYKWYLRYAIKYRKDITLSSDDPDLKKFEGLVDALFNNLYSGQDSTIITN